MTVIAHWLQDMLIVAGIVLGLLIIARRLWCTRGR